MDFILKNIDSDALQEIFWKAMSQGGSSSTKVVKKDNSDSDDDTTDNADDVPKWNLPKLTTEQWIWIIIVGGFIFYAVYRVILYAFIAYILYSFWKAISK